MWFFFFRQKKSPRPGRTKLYSDWVLYGCEPTKTRADTLYHHYINVNKIPSDQIKVEKV